MHFHSISDAYLPMISCRFLLVSLNIDAILGEVTIRQRRKKLEEMTLGGGLSDAYTATLMRLRAQKGYKSVLGLKVLMWVMYSERPLQARELCHALGVEIGSADMDLENVPALRTLVSSCLGLVTVEVSSSTVRLVHFTLQEHLSRDPTLFHDPHSAIAEVCLTYLNFGYIKDLSPAHDLAPAETPLLEYASIYWGRHTRKGTTERLKMLSLRLLDRFDEHISAQLQLLQYNRDGDDGLYFYGSMRAARFTGLHAVAFLGIAGIVPAVLEMREWDVNAYDCMGMTALTWAAARGHEEVVTMFLRREDVNLNQADTEYGHTPLSWAAKKGHLGIVKMLLGREGVNPDKADTEYGRTLLSWAVENGHEGMVEMLLEREDVNPNQTVTFYGHTPLSWAAEKGHEGIVKILLEREGVNPDKADTLYGRTPLWWAAGKGHLGIVKMLLGRKDVNLNQAVTLYGQTPLSWAAQNGHEGIVKMLLEQEGVNPDKADTEYGRTPLSWAARNGHLGIVKMLLGRKDVNLNQAVTLYGQTPLSWAAKKGHEGIVKMLLGRKDVNINQADTKYGQTPLSWAAENGHEGIVKILLEQEGVNPDKADTLYDRTPLSRAARNGHEGIVKMLLQREGVNPDYADTNCGRTPLWWAAKNGHLGIVKMLLQQEDVNPDEADTEYGLTPLLCAAGSGYEEIVKTLLEREDVNPDWTDTKYGLTPLLWAAESGYGGVVKVLLERGDVNPNNADTKYGRTPLSWAAENGHEGIVKILLEREGVNPDQADTKYGLTPLSWAAEGGHEGIVKMLSQRRDVCAATPDSTNQTPQPLALSEEHDTIVSIQQERGNVNCVAADRGSPTSLLSSSLTRDECVVGMQLQSHDSNTDPTDFNFQPEPLPAALHQRPRLLHLGDSVPGPADGGPSAQPPRWPRSLFIWPSELRYPPRKTDAHANTQPIFSFAVDRSFIIASLVCLFAFLLYIFLSSSLDIFSFRKHLPGEGLV